jgi:mono/diheme cytochrome c family protein
MWKKWSWTVRTVVVLVAVFILMQLIPFGRSQQNPPVTGEPQWDTPRTRELFFKACADCHSNETKWPWYTHVAPASWLVSHDVEDGRKHFNISEWDQKRKQDADEAAEQIEEGEMPLWFYVPLHPEADLSAAEKQELINGLSAMFNQHKDGDEDEH